MKRRNIIKALGAGSAVAAIVPRAAAQGPQVTWRIAAAAGHTQDILFNAPRNLARTVEELTGGGFKIQVFGPGEIVPVLSIYDGVEKGTVEMGYTASYFSAGRDPAFALGSSLPFGPNARLQRAWFHAGGLALMNEFYRKHGTIMFPGGNTGAQMAGWFRKEIRSKADLSGLKMRVAGIGGAILSRMGVISQTLPGGDIYPALERGVIDAAEVSGPFDDERFGFSKIAPWYYYPGFTEGNVEMSFFANLEKWNALPKTYQAALRVAANLAADEVLWRYDAEQTAPLRRLIAAGVKVRPLPQDIVDAARPIAQTLYREYSDKSPDFKRIYEHYSAFTQQAYQWWQVSEFGYDSMMVRQARQK